MNGAGFAVELQTITSTQMVYSTTAETLSWEHLSFDLDAWVGNTITATFRTHQVAGGAPVWALLDDVTLGSIYPDVYVQADAKTVRPGEVFTSTLWVGNQGGVLAGGVALSAKLPAGLSFVLSSPDPDSQTKGLQWTLGDLPTKCQGIVIQVVLQAPRYGAVPQTLQPVFSLSTTSREIETANNTLALTIIIPLFTLWIPLIKR